MGQSGEGVTMRLALILMTVTGAAHAQSIDGLYRPDETWAESWSCNPDDIGMDGGAVGIHDGMLYGVENTCELSEARRVGDGTAFTALCSGEGETYRLNYVIVPTATGITLARDGETVSWRRCEQDAATSENTWVSGFAMGVVEASTNDGNGNSITMSCRNGLEGSVYLSLSRRPATGDVRFNVDGQSFELPAWGEGGRLNVECNVCVDNYTALWSALQAGKQVTISDDTNQATLSLEGSADALSPEPCIPEGW